MGVDVEWWSEWGSSLLLAHLSQDRDGKRGLNFVLGLITPDPALIPLPPR